MAPPPSQDVVTKMSGSGQLAQMVVAMMAAVPATFLVIGFGLVVVVVATSGIENKRLFQTDALHYVLKDLQRVWMA